VGALVIPQHGMLTDKVTFVSSVFRISRGLCLCIKLGGTARVSYPRKQQHTHANGVLLHGRSRNKCWNISSHSVSLPVQVQFVVCLLGACLILMIALIKPNSSESELSERL